jgi:iron complex transport system ATP-binding protein
MRPLLVAEQLAFGYRSPVVAGIALQVRPGECWALLGSNGAGKTTLLRLLGGLATPHRGTVLLDGTPASLLRPRERARRIGILPQGLPRAEGYTVAELVLMGLYATMPARGWEGFSEWRAVARALECVGAKELLRRPFSELSGGEQRRVLLARALVSRPDLLLLDEPLASLDPGFALEMTALLARVKQGGTALVLATHNLPLALRLADGVLLLRRGSPAVAGPPEELLIPETLNAVYGTTAFGDKDVCKGPNATPSLRGSTALRLHGAV